MSFENAIRTQRTRKGISLRSMATELGISASQLSKIETGKGSVATVIIKNGTLQEGDHFTCGSSSVSNKRTI